MTVVVRAAFGLPTAIPFRAVSGAAPVSGGTDVAFRSAEIVSTIKAGRRTSSPSNMKTALNKAAA